MAKPEIKPEKIRTPIQLLAVWFAALVIVSGSFLAGAASISAPTWIAPMLAIAAVAFVPVFLVAAVLMQTKFRAQLQEDKYYLDWLKWRDSRVRLIKREVQAVRDSLPPLVEAGGDAASTAKSVEEAVQTIEQAVSLDPTQAKILAILSDGALGYLEIRRRLASVYGTETTPSAARVCLDDLVGVGVVVETSDSTYELTEAGKRLL